MKQFLYTHKGINEYLGVISGRCEQDTYRKALQRFGYQPKDKDNQILIEQLDCECEWDIEVMNRAALMTEHEKFTLKKMNSFLSQNTHALLRQEINRNYGFGIPTAETIQIVKNYGPLVEVGCGTGWWARLLYLANCDIVATDCLSFGKLNRWWQVVGRYHHLETLEAEDAVKRYPNRNVLMVWPPKDDLMANKVAKAMIKGQKLLVVHAGQGGIIAEDSFFKTLEKKFQVISEIPIANYPWTFDQMFVYEKVIE